MKDVLKQCSSMNLVPSMIFKDSDFGKVNLAEITNNGYDNQLDTVTMPLNIICESTVSKIENKIISNDINNIEEYKIRTLTQNIEQHKQHILQVKEDILAEKIKLTKVKIFFKFQMERI